MAAKEAEARATSLMRDPNGTTSWQHPSSGIQISMPVAAVRMLSTESLRRLRAEEPSELGGILRGTIHQDEQGYRTLFLDPEIISSSSRLFNTSKAESDSIVAAAETARKSGQAVMGYFRSHIRDGLCLSREDEFLIRQHFQDPESVFLIIRPFEIGICMAGFFFWEHGRLQTDVSELEVPFVVPEADEQALAASRASELESFQSLAQSLEKSLSTPARAGKLSQSAEPEQQDPETREEATEQIDEANLPLPPERKHGPVPSTEPLPQAPALVSQDSAGSRSSPVRRSRVNLRRLTLLFAALLAVGACIYVGVTKPGIFVSLLPTRESRTEIGLQVRAAPGGQIDLTWDRSSPRLQLAQGATLVVIDGKARRELYLDKNQLRFGRLTYFSTSGDVQFSLEIHIDNARSITESIRVLPPQFGSTHVPRDTAAANPAPTRPEPESSLGQSHAAPRRSNISVASIQQGRSANIHVPARATPGKVAGQPEIPVTASAAAGPSPTKVVPPPPLDLLAGGSVNSVPHISISALPLPSPPQPDSSAPGRSPTKRDDAKLAYVPAQPIRQVMPSKPPLAPSTYRAVDIVVQVKVDEHGLVTEAHLLPQAGTDAALATRAISAAKQWIFQPAKLRGKNVPSDHTIVFRFRPVE